MLSVQNLIVTFLKLNIVTFSDGIQTKKGIKISNIPTNTMICRITNMPTLRKPEFQEKVTPHSYIYC